jgi:tetratricopeptide (TPR) repeat protein
MHDAGISRQVDELIALAEGLRQSGQLDEAETVLLALNGVAPNPRGMRSLGLVLASRGAWDQAVKVLSEAPPDGEVLNALAVCQLQVGQPATALDLARRAVALGAPFALTNQGAALVALGRLEEACQAFREALAIDAADQEAQVNLAAALQGLGRCAEALAEADKAIARDSAIAAAHAVRGNALNGLDRKAEAIGSYDRALLLDPNQPRLQLNRGYCHLVLGQFAQGWRDHEARLSAPGALGPSRPLPMPRWDGGPLQGKTILLHCEQGLGDAIQFIRYAELVAGQGATVILEAFQPLERLLKTAPGVHRVITRRDPLPPLDHHIHLMSLPFALGRPQPFTPDAPYLSAPDDARERWRGRLAEPGRLRVGLCASGNPAQGNDANRSIPLASLLAALPPGPAYVLLHKDVRAADQAALAARPDVAFLGDEITDFADTAAIVEQLDVVISVDTGVSHLAGALGKPVWILACIPADWRYAQDPVRCDWYPSAVVYRQTTPGDWPGVLERVRRDLTALSSARGV